MGTIKRSLKHSKDFSETLFIESPKMTKYFNLNTANFINLNAIVLLTLACATQGRVYHCASRFADCGTDFDKAYAHAMATVKAELLAKGVLTTKDIKALDNAAFQMTCAVYNAMCETTEERMTEYFMREVNRTLKFEQVAKTDAFAYKFLLPQAGAYDLDIAELLSYAIAIATDNRVYNKPLVYGVLRSHKVEHKAHGLTNSLIKTIKELGKIMAKSLNKKCMVLDSEVPQIERAIRIVLECAQLSYERHLEYVPGDLDVLAFSDCFMYHLSSNAVVLGGGLTKASQPYNFHDFDDWF